MDEYYVSTSRVVAVAAWGVTGSLVFMSWLVLLAYDLPALAAMLCMTGGVFAVPAGVLSVRCYFVRLGRMIRVTAGLAPELESGDLHAVH